jgi:hypothetical protein
LIREPLLIDRSVAVRFLVLHDDDVGHKTRGADAHENLDGTVVAALEGLPVRAVGRIAEQTLGMRLRIREVGLEYRRPSLFGTKRRRRGKQDLQLSLFFAGRGLPGKPNRSGDDREHQDGESL